VGVSPVPGTGSEAKLAVSAAHALRVPLQHGVLLLEGHVHLAQAPQLCLPRFVLVQELFSEDGDVKGGEAITVPTLVSIQEGIHEPRARVFFLDLLFLDLLRAHLVGF